MKTLGEIDSYDFDNDSGCSDPDCCGGREYYMAIANDGEGEFIKTEDLRKEAIAWIKHIQSEPFPLFPNKEVKIPWFDGDELTLNNGEQIFAAKAVLQAFFNIREEDLQ